MPPTNLFLEEYEARFRWVVGQDEKRIEIDELNAFLARWEHLLIEQGANACFVSDQSAATVADNDVFQHRKTAYGALALLEWTYHRLSDNLLNSNSRCESGTLLKHANDSVAHKRVNTEQPEAAQRPKTAKRSNKST